MFALVSVILVTNILTFVVTGHDDEQEEGEHIILVEEGHLMGLLVPANLPFRRSIWWFPQNC